MSTPGDILPTGDLSWEAMPEAPLQAVASFCRAQELFSGCRRVLVACSGGADSLALVALLSHPRFMALAGLEPGPELVVGHVDHGLRPGSDADAAAVARLSEGLGLPCVAETLHWPAGDAGGASGERVWPAGEAPPPAPGATSEAQAREARLAALERLAGEVGADAIALGHQATDQLETQIMRLLRGCGLRGLAGMAPRRGRFRRPLLCLAGEETRALVAALGWRPREDPTNASDAFLRNRIRHHVVPLLEAENPRAAQAAHRTAQVLGEELEVLDGLEAATWERLGTLAPGGPSVKVEALLALPVGLAARIVRRMWRLVVGEEQAGGECRGGGGGGGGGRGGGRGGGGSDREAATGELAAGTRELGREHVSQVFGLLGSEEGTRRVDLPSDVVALRSYDRLVLAARRRLEDPGDVEVSIPGPGRYAIEAFGLALEVLDTTLASPYEPARPREKGGEADDHLTDSLLVHGFGEPGDWGLRVRNVRPGDRVRTSAGHRKVSDLMVDRKIPLPDRRRTPILESGSEILWIPGLYRAERCQEALLSGEGGPVGEGGPPRFRLVFRRLQAGRRGG